MIFARQIGAYLLEHLIDDALIGAIDHDDIRTRSVGRRHFMVDGNQGKTAARALHHGREVLIGVLRAAINNNDCANSCIRQTLNDVLHGDGADLGFNSLKDQVAEARRTLFFLFRRWTERFVNETRLAVP
jgi:hypothetical protein